MAPKRKSAEVADAPTSTESSNGKKAKATAYPLEGLTPTKFMQAAGEIKITIEYPGQDEAKVYVAKPKTFSTGSFGWSVAGQKMKLPVVSDGKTFTLPVGLSANFTVDKSKKAAKAAEDEAAGENGEDDSEEEEEEEEEAPKKKKEKKEKEPKEKVVKEKVVKEKKEKAPKEKKESKAAAASKKK